MDATVKVTDGTMEAVEEVIVVYGTMEAAPEMVEVEITITDENAEESEPEEACDCEGDCGDSCGCKSNVVQLNTAASNPIPDNVAAPNGPYWETSFLPVINNITDTKKELPATIKNLRETYIGVRSDEAIVSIAKNAHFNAVLAKKVGAGIVSIIVNEPKIREWLEAQGAQLAHDLSKKTEGQAKNDMITHRQLVANQFLMLVFIPELAEYYRQAVTEVNGAKLYNGAMRSYMGLCVDTINDYVNMFFQGNEFFVREYVGDIMYRKFADDNNIPQIFSAMEKVGGEGGARIKQYMVAGIQTTLNPYVDAFFCAGYLTFNNPTEIHPSLKKLVVDQKQRILKEFFGNNLGLVNQTKPAYKK